MSDPSTPPPFDPSHLSAPAQQGTFRWAAQVVGGYKVYGQGDSEVRALDGITVGFEPARFTAIMGPSGSGKSTLMQCAAGLDRLSAGTVMIGEVDITRLGEKQLTLLRREKVGFVFQQFNLLPTLTARENITFPLDLAGRRPDPEWMERVVATVGLADRLSHRPSELSGGQQQRVAVARALVERPEIIFADEPTGNLDSHSSAEILGFMRSAVDEFAQSVVMVTHDPVAATYADRVLFLNDGRLVDEVIGPTRDEVLARMGALAV